MTPPGDEPIQLRIAEVVDGEVFVDEARVDELGGSPPSPSQQTLIFA